MLHTVAQNLSRRLPNVVKLAQVPRQMSSASPPASVWSLGKLNHVAIVVPDLSQATALYRDMLGASVSKPQVLKRVSLMTLYASLIVCRTFQSTV